MKRFQYVSDLHLDMRKNKYNTPESWTQLIPVSAPHLILAGDIAQLTWDYYRLFLQHCSETRETTFLVLGNHEYYGGSIEEGNTLAKELTKGLLNVHLLQQTHHILGDLNVVGCTLWSHIPPHARADCARSLGDFYAIDGMTVNEYNDLHKCDRKWIEDTINKVEGKCLVITHHAPLLKKVSDPKYELDETRTFNHAFCSDLDVLFDTIPDGSCWVFGHTHYRNEFIHKNVNVLTNALGYRGEIETPYTGKTFELE